METDARSAGLISILISIGLLVFSEPLNAAGNTLRLENDSNSRLGVKNAIVHGDTTTILFWTWPDRGDPNARKDCAMSYYSVMLQPGLPAVEPRLMAKDVCAGRAILHGGLLEDGSGKFIVRDRLELWRDGERISSDSFSSIDHVKTQGIDSVEIGSQFAAFTSAGDLVMAIMANGYNVSEWPGVSWIVTGLKANNEKRWLLKYNDTDESFMVESLWAGQDGGALLYISATDMTSTVPVPVSSLLVITANGQDSILQLVEVPEPLDLGTIRPGSIEDLKKAFQKQDNNRPESFRKLSARPRPGAGFDVLYERESPDQSRDGYFLLRLAGDGSVQTEISLKSSIKDHGLERWFDFYVEGDQLVLLSNYPVTQPGVSSNRRAWPQTIVSRLDLNSLDTVSRLIPLDQQYLEAAMNAGDEGQQYLEGKPGGEPLLLTTLAGTPLSVSRGWLNERNTLRFYEVTNDLVTFTEAYDKQQAKLAREQKSSQAKADRTARQQQLNKDMKDATGLSQKEFDSLSKEEQVMHLMKEGNMEAMMATVMKQAQSAQAGMTPEQAAQMQQLIPGGGLPSAGASISQQTPQEPSAKPVASFTVDALMRGRIQYDGSNGETIVLSIINRQNGKELTNREFADGMIDEYVSLGRYKLPVEQIGALIKRLDGQVLKDLKPQIN